MSGGRKPLKIPPAREERDFHDGESDAKKLIMKKVRKEKREEESGLRQLLDGQLAFSDAMVEFRLIAKDVLDEALVILCALARLVILED